MQLKGASVVITGAAHGLGAALARELVSRGAEVVLSDLDTSELQDIGVELDMPTMHCNVTDRYQVEALGRAAIEEFGKIDLWINNAGIWMTYTPSQNIDFNHAHRLMEVNCFGLAYGMVEAAKHMTPIGEGTIANIISVRALKGKALAASYCASKFAAEGFTQSVREEVKDSGVSVLSFYPYRIKTGLFGENRHEDYEQSMEPVDVARIIVDELAANTSEHVEIWSKDDVRKR